MGFLGWGTVTIRGHKMNPVLLNQFALWYKVSRTPSAPSVTKCHIVCAPIGRSFSKSAGGWAENFTGVMLAKGEIMDSYTSMLKYRSVAGVENTRGPAHWPFFAGKIFRILFFHLVNFICKMMSLSFLSENFEYNFSQLQMRCWKYVMKCKIYYLSRRKS